MPLAEQVIGYRRGAATNDNKQQTTKTRESAHVADSWAWERPFQVAVADLAGWDRTFRGERWFGVETHISRRGWAWLWEWQGGSAHFKACVVAVAGLAGWERTFCALAFESMGGERLRR